MNQLKIKLDSRIDERFFGNDVRTAFLHADGEVVRKLSKEFVHCIEHMREYIFSRINLNDEFVFAVSKLSLETDFTFTELKAVAEKVGKFGGVQIDEDGLFDEFSLVKSCFSAFCVPDISLVSRWNKVFKSGGY